jgi:hypothetical protein
VSWYQELARVDWLNLLDQGHRDLKAFWAYFKYFLDASVLEFDA